MLNLDRVGLSVLFFTPALWQVQSLGPTLFFVSLWDGCVFVSSICSFSCRADLEKPSLSTGLNFGVHYNSRFLYGKFSIHIFLMRFVPSHHWPFVLLKGHVLSAAGKCHLRGSQGLCVQAPTAKQGRPGGERSPSDLGVAPSGWLCRW